MHSTNKTRRQSRGCAQQQRQRETRASKTSATKAQSLCISCSYPATCPRLLCTTVPVNRLLLCLLVSFCGTPARVACSVATPVRRGCCLGFGSYRRRLGGACVNVCLAQIVFDVLVEWARRWRVVWEQRGGRVRCNKLAAAPSSVLLSSLPVLSFCSFRICRNSTGVSIRRSHIVPPHTILAPSSSALCADPRLPLHSPHGGRPAR
jgi:hypothetical protein